MDVQQRIKEIRKLLRTYLLKITNKAVSNKNHSCTKSVTVMAHAPLNKCNFFISD